MGYSGFALRIHRRNSKRSSDIFIQLPVELDDKHAYEIAYSLVSALARYVPGDSISDRPALWVTLEEVSCDG